MIIFLYPIKKVSSIPSNTNKSFENYSILNSSIDSQNQEFYVHTEKYFKVL